MLVGDPMLLSAPCFFLSRGSILPPVDRLGLDVADHGNRDPETTCQVVPLSLAPPPRAAPPSTNSCMAGRMAFTTLSTCTTALGGVCPALHPRGCGVCEVRLARLPHSGNPWAHKVLFGQGEISPKPKAPPPAVKWAGKLDGVGVWPVATPSLSPPPPLQSNFFPPR